MDGPHVVTVARLFEGVAGLRALLRRDADMAEWPEDIRVREIP